MQDIKIENLIIGQDHKSFIIAELSANHNHDFEVAAKTVRAAKEAGADAIKLQTYTADTITLDSDKPHFRLNQGTIWDGTTFYKLYQQAYTPWEWQPKLKQMAEDIGLVCFSSPFDPTAVDFLEQMDVPAYKIASFEIHDLPLIAYTAAKGKPMIISTGIAEAGDIQAVIRTCKAAGNEQIILLKCTSSYPAPVEEANLRTIPNMAETFDTLVGLSDHTLEVAVPIAAVALGARVIEKHFILDREIGGPDASFSLTPDQFAAMVQGVRAAEQALGEVTYELSQKSKRSREYGRSLFITQDVKAGERLSPENVRSIRPGYGLHPKYLPDILDKVVRHDLEKGTPLKWEHIN